MKICEANEQTLGGAKSEPIKFSFPLFWLASRIPFPRPPFPFLELFLCPFPWCKLSGYAYPYLYPVFLYEWRRERKRNERNKVEKSSRSRTIFETNWPSERNEITRGSFAFQLADSCPQEETLIGYKNRRENNEIIVNQYAPPKIHFARSVARVRSGTVTRKTSALRSIRVKILFPTFFYLNLRIFIVEKQERKEIIESCNQSFLIRM